MFDEIQALLKLGETSGLPTIIEMRTEYLTMLKLMHGDELIARQREYETHQAMMQQQLGYQGLSQDAYQAAQQAQLGQYAHQQALNSPAPWDLQNAGMLDQ